MNSLSGQSEVKAFWAVRKFRWGMLVATGLLAGCAALAPAPPEERVKARAQARWDKLLKADFRGAYEYFSTGSRAGYTEDEFQLSIRRGFWKSATVDKVACGSPDSCEVDVAVEYEFKGIRNTTPVRETWVRDGGEWWYLRK